MVGNLAERAAEAIGADPLVTRVAAYYHDIGKLSNPLAFIENQAGGENIHDQLEPEVSAEILKQHVADGIDIAYRAKLPKALIAYIPQHHGTAIMSYFYAPGTKRASAGSTGGRRLRAVDERRFRHAGPKPQTREAALIMLADGVEASVRSLASRDEPAIRAMVTPDHRGADRRRPVRRVRPHAARPRADPRGVRRAAPRDVPHAGRLSAEHRRRAGIAASGRRRERLGLVTRAIYRRPWRIDVDHPRRRPPAGVGRGIGASGRFCAGRGPAPSPASIGLILSDDAELAG